MHTEEKTRSNPGVQTDLVSTICREMFVYSDGIDRKRGHSSALYTNNRSGRCRASIMVVYRGARTTDAENQLDTGEIGFATRTCRFLWYVCRLRDTPPVDWGEGGGGAHILQMKLEV